MTKINEYLSDENDFLRCLPAIADFTNKVYANGFLPLDRRPTVAIIGTRRPTPYGSKLAFDFAEKLARVGVVIVSGLAYGIDTAAHRGALAGGGVTIAVLAHGLDRLYPPGNKDLALSIIENKGALISPYPEGTPVHKFRFLERNQWVSGLADAVLVIEAEERSGTKATVRYALDQGKEVFAIPGPITSSQSVGPNKLIQEGAHVALSPDDILTVIAPHLLKKYDQHIDDPADITAIIQALQREPQSTDELALATLLDHGQLYTSLTLLEIDGRISQHAGKWYGGE